MCTVHICVYLYLNFRLIAICSDQCVKLNQYVDSSTNIWHCQRVTASFPSLSVWLEGPPDSWLTTTLQSKLSLWTAACFSRDFSVRFFILGWGIWVQLQITVSANSTNLPKSLKQNKFSFFFFNVAVIGLDDSNKCMSCCPMLLLFFFLQHMFLCDSSLAEVPLTLLKGKMSPFFFFFFPP